MGHIPEDENYEEFMDASAESWSEPDEPESEPEQVEPTDRWGSPLPEEESAPDTQRWGSEPLKSAESDYELPGKKSGNRWWIIAIIVLVVLCLCACIAVFVLPLIGLNIFSADIMQF